MGRPPGLPNKVTQVLKAAALGAAEDVGEDGRGKDGLRGYLRHLARTEPAVFGGILRRMMPVQVKAEVEPGGLLAKMLQTAEAQRAAQANGRTIDVTPTPAWRRRPTDE